MMKRKIVSLFLIIMMITVLFLLTGCVSKEKKLDNCVHISMEDNGSTMGWNAYVIIDEDIIKYKYSEREDESKYEGYEGYTVNVDYYFEGIKEGKTEIWVVDAFPGQISSITKYYISVDSDLKAKIIDSAMERNRIKCGYLEKENQNSQIDIEDESIARDISTWRWYNKATIMGIKEGNTNLTVKEDDGTEKKYIVKVDANLNVELEEK